MVARKLVLGASVGAVLITTLLAWPDALATMGSQPLVVELPAPELDETVAGDSEQQVWTRYEIRTGDYLTGIAEKLGVSKKDIYQLAEADMEFLYLDNLKPGQVLEFRKTDSGSLEAMRLIINPAEVVDYELLPEGGYQVIPRDVQGDWQDVLVQGTVDQNFSVAAKNAGLSMSETQEVINQIQDKFDFRRQLRRGDRFEVLVSRQWVNGQLSGKSHIEAIHMLSGRKPLKVYYYDGQYYDQNGEGLKRAFTRYPFHGHYRISSPFNPKRKHPVTHRISPHNGTDFALPSGTPVYSTGDGVVARVIRHQFAGLYVEIDHGSIYRTRYLHLSKAYVKKGQKIRRGQKIALSGNTGRSTGAHLHYEFHVRGRPVNAMKADIPMAASVKKSQKAAFAKLTSQYEMKMQSMAYRD